MEIDTNKKMLLLDRGNDILSLAHEIMFYGYSDMHITSDPDAVCEIAKAYKPDLVLLDFIFAHDNFDVIRQQFKDNKILKHIPLIVVSTAYNKVFSNNWAQSDTTYIKPLDNQDFATTIGYLMAS